tara:strand:+ start:222 stop:434 length:213 start_codon:yes stop_codon:yes gene_type:complete
MGKLISFALLEDRIILILLSFIKLGIIRTKSKGFSGISVVLGLWRIESQLNISLVSDILMEFKEYEKARA